MGSSPPVFTPQRRPGHEIGLDTQHATPPVDAYVTQDDSLWAMVSTSQAGVLMTVIARILLPDGTIVINNWPVSMTNGRIATYTQIRLPEGFLLSVSATANLGVTAPPAYIALYLSRSVPGSFQAAQLLCSGYTYNNAPISWPDGVNSTSVDVKGTIISQAIASPAAGANFSMTVPTNTMWHLMALQFTLTASAAVANRFFEVTFDNGVSTFLTVANSGALTASQVGVGVVSDGAALAGAGALVFQLNVSPTMRLMAGYRIQSAIQNLQAADQISAVVGLVEEWLLP